MLNAIEGSLRGLVGGGQQGGGGGLALTLGEARLNTELTRG